MDYWPAPSGRAQLSRRGRRHGLLSLSRLNHRLPGREAHPEVVQGTAEFHYQITDALLPQAGPVFHDATTFYTAYTMLDPQPSLFQRQVGSVVRPRHIMAAGWLRRD